MSITAKMAAVDPAVVESLRQVLDLPGIPWDRQQVGSDRHIRPRIEFMIRSTRTLAEIVDGIADPARKARKRDEIEMLGVDPQSYDEVQWDLTCPHIDSDFFRNFTYTDWLRYVALDIPAGYVPSRLTPEEILRRGLRDPLWRDKTIRAALADGVPVKDLVARTGLTRARIYQIRDAGRP